MYTDTNHYGEWLFITLEADLPRLHSWQRDEPQRRQVTFWGLGYHDARERWLVDEWRWHESSPWQHTPVVIGKREARAALDARRAHCAAEAAVAESPSGRARLYGLICDPTDEDGAPAELRTLTRWLLMTPWRASAMANANDAIAARALLAVVARTQAGVQG